MGMEEKMESLLKRFRSFVVIHYCQPQGGGGGGAFSRDLPQIWPHSAGLIAGGGGYK